MFWLCLNIPTVQNNFSQTFSHSAKEITKKDQRCILVLHLCVFKPTLFPVAISRAPSDWSAPSSATLVETGLESRRMFT